MKFRRVRFKNFRLLRDLELEFSTSDEHPLTVIRAENETGKTTMLNALQWALFGNDGLPDGGDLYRLHPIDWDESQAKTVPIEVELEFEHRYEREDKKTGQWIENTEVYLAYRRTTETIVNPNQWNRATDSFDLMRKSDRGFTPVPGGELALRQILESNLKDLFFTDGDRALSFITSEISVGEKRKRVQKAIRDLLGFDILQTAISHVRKAGAEIRGQVKEAGGTDDLQKVAARISDLETKIADAEKRSDTIELQLSQMAVDIDSVEQKIAVASAKGDKEQLIQELRSKRDELASARTLLDRVRRDHSALFSQEALPTGLLSEYVQRAGAMLNELKAKGRIPRTAIPVLQERLELGVCICGTKLEPGHPTYEHIKALIEEQQQASETDDRLTNLRLIANQRIALLESDDEAWGSGVKKVVERRNELEARIQTLEGEVKVLDAKVDELPETDVAFLRDHRRKLRQTRENLIRDKGINDADLRRYQQDKKQADEDWATLSKKQKLSRRIQSRLTAADDMLAVIAKSYAAIEQSEIPQVSDYMNKYFLEMIVADPQQNAIIRKAEVTSSYDIGVWGPLDRYLDPDRDLNGASRRALTLAFILALTEVSGTKAPNVIDTPLGMMSGQVKQSVLRTAISHSTQLVLFLTRSEIRDCEEILDKEAGVVVTLSSSAHYPKMLRNDPGASWRKVLSCKCNHHQYCAVCERTGDADNSALSLRK
ncbi:MAG: AAA family ATPase [Chloroflexi bacterium]|nr:AAA family ATPase [Chloroflexota bacterium]